MVSCGDLPNLGDRAQGYSRKNPTSEKGIRTLAHQQPAIKHNQQTFGKTAPDLLVWFKFAYPMVGWLGELLIVSYCMLLRARFLPPFSLTSYLCLILTF